MQTKAVLKWVGMCICLLLCGVLLAACGKEDAQTPPAADVSESQTAAPSPTDALTGLPVSADAVGKRPVAVMVENHPQARPQWGLSTPDIVIEGVAEGGITRMMWLYSDVRDMPKVGPTRSARHDYVELAEGFDAIYVHFGGSTYAYDTIERDKVDDVDGMSSKYFARDKSRKVASEHTAYTTGENIQKAIADKGYRTEVKAEKATSFTFSSEKRSLSDGACRSVKVMFSDNYCHTFRYNETDGLYYNHMNANEMKDADGKTMTVSNVLILYTEVSGVSGSKSGHQDWDLQGGTGLYVSNGTYQSIRWSKGAASAPLTLTDANGTPLQLNTGKSWIGFVPKTNADRTELA